MRRTEVYLGWPTIILGPCNVNSSAMDENYAVVCYDELGTAEHGFLVFQKETIGTVSQMWLMGHSGEEIGKVVTHE